MGRRRQTVQRVLRAAWENTWKLKGAAGFTWTALLFVVGYFGSWLVAIILFAFGIVATVTSISAYRLAENLGDEQAKPRAYLTFTGTETKPAAVVPLPHVAAAFASTAATATPVSTTTTTYVMGTPANPVNDHARAFVANDPPNGAEGQLAEKVTASIAFFDASDTNVRTIQGRWAETAQRGERKQLSVTYESVQLDIEPNGLPHPLDVAMKAPADAHFYAYNDDNQEHRDGRLPEHKLDGGEYRVVITLRGSNAGPVAQEFKLTNGGVGGSITLTQV